MCTSVRSVILSFSSHWKKRSGCFELVVRCGDPQKRGDPRGFLEALGCRLGPDGEGGMARPWGAGRVRGRRCLKTPQMELGDMCGEIRPGQGPSKGSVWKEKL